MSELQLLKTQMVARDGTPTRLVYDEEADILEIFLVQVDPVRVSP